MTDEKLKELAGLVVEAVRQDGGFREAIQLATEFQGAELQTAKADLTLLRAEQAELKTQQTLLRFQAKILGVLFVAVVAPILVAFALKWAA